jgi:hypothetical protein
VHGGTIKLERPNSLKCKVSGLVSKVLKNTSLIDVAIIGATNTQGLMISTLNLSVAAGSGEM